MSEALSREEWQNVVVQAAKDRGIDVVMTPGPWTGAGKTWQYRKVDGSLSRESRFLWSLCVDYLRERYALLVTPEGTVKVAPL